MSGYGLIEGNADLLKDQFLFMIGLMIVGLVGLSTSAAASNRVSVVLYRLGQSSV